MGMMSKGFGFLKFHDDLISHINGEHWVKSYRKVTMKEFYRSVGGSWNIDLFDNGFEVGFGLVPITDGLFYEVDEDTANDILHILNMWKAGKEMVEGCICQNPDMCSKKRGSLCEIALRESADDLCADFWWDDAKDECDEYESSPTCTACRHLDEYVEEK